MGPIIVDTGFFVALFNQKDQFHEPARKAATKYDSRQWVSSVFTIQETFWQLSKKNSRSKAEDFLAFAKDEIRFPELPSDWLSKIQEILKKYRSIDLADASLVILAECVSTCDIFTSDRFV